MKASFPSQLVCVFPSNNRRSTLKTALLWEHPLESGSSPLFGASIHRPWLPKDNSPRGADGNKIQKFGITLDLSSFEPHGPCGSVSEPQSSQLRNGLTAFYRAVVGIP